MADEKIDPISAMLAIDDEAARAPAPEAEVKIDPPADKPEPERDEQGKFKGKEEKAEKPEPVKEPDKAEKPKETVPLAKYLEDKNSLKKQLEDRDITLAQYRKELDELKAKLPQPQAPAEPDFVEDPKAYVDHKVKATLDAIAEANKKTEAEGKTAKETAEQAQQAVQIQQFMTNLQQHEARFVQANPDYHDALLHLRNVRAAQLREFDPEITDAQILETIKGEETNLAIQLHRQGRDPVQTAYNLAKHFGYQKKAATTETPKLPEATNKRLPPDQTLGTGAGGGADAPAYKEGETDPVDVALASLFKKSA